MKSGKKLKVPAKKLVQQPKRVLFYDIEVSPNLVFTWNIGNRISIGHDSIVQERAIISICYKFQGEKKIHALKWDKGDDYQLVLKFSKVLQQADVVIGHNSVSFDTKWVMARLLYHGIRTDFHFKEQDTLKIARRLFRLNSNKLDYIARYLGYGGKKDTGGFQTWKDIVLKNSTKAMNRMVFYNKGDVELLEKIHKKLEKYLPKKIKK